MGTREKFPATVGIPSALRSGESAPRSRALATGVLWVLCLWPWLADATEVYRWQDAEGQVHYSDRPPAAAAERLDLPDHPGPDGDSVRRQARTRRLLDAYAGERAERAQSRAAAREAAVAREHACVQARERQFRFEHAARVYRHDADGNRIVLEGEAHREVLARARADVAELCGKS